MIRKQNDTSDKGVGKSPAPSNKLEVIEDFIEYDPSRGVTVISEWRRREMWDGYSVTNDADEIFVYCLVSVEGYEKALWYRTRNPYVKEGDTVVVPFGKSYERRLGRVELMEGFSASEVPFPVQRTKYIVGRAKQTIKK
jgi:hypothetical protein